MRIRRVVLSAVCGSLALAVSSEGGGLLPAEQCQLAKQRAVGKLVLCHKKLLGASDPQLALPTWAKCVVKFTNAFAKAETKGACPTVGDAATIALQVTRVADQAQVGHRYVDNSDGTIIDTETGLQWEQKTGIPGSANICGDYPACPDVHDVNNIYPWTTDDRFPTGAAFTNFIGRLNGAFDGACFANHCDWRLPTKEEFKTILGSPPACGTACIDLTAFSPLLPTAHYWTSTTVLPGSPPSVTGPQFVFAARADIANVGVSYKYPWNNPVRAVRGGL